MTRHVGGNGGRELWRRMIELVRDNTRRYLSGAPRKHVVRTPDGTLRGFENWQTGNCVEGLVSRDRRAIREKIEAEPKIRK